jgi:hypothetical protein
MSNPFRIEIHNWLVSAFGTPEVRETFAELSITVGSWCATEVDDRRARSVRKTIRVSAYVLASWLVANWWRLRWEPDRRSLLEQAALLDYSMTHHLEASGGGYLWPPLTFTSDGASIHIQCDVSGRGARDHQQPIRFLNSFGEWLSAKAYEEGVARFVEGVLARLDSLDLRKTELHEAWEELFEERRKRPLASRRKLEALSGIDPDDDPALVKELLGWEKKVGREAVGEIAAAQVGDGIRKVLLAVDEAEKGVGTFGRVGGLHAIRQELGDFDVFGGDTPWRLGYRAAEVVRRVWGLGGRSLSNEELAQNLNLSKHVLESSIPNLPATVGVRGDGDEQLKLLLKPSSATSRRFEIARLIGDQVGVESTERWKPVTTSVTARQKYQRAFAAELLCPWDQLQTRFVGMPLNRDFLQERIAETADEFQVAEEVVWRNLENRGTLPSPW